MDVTSFHPLPASEFSLAKFVIHPLPPHMYLPSCTLYVSASFYVRDYISNYLAGIFKPARQSSTWPGYLAGYPANCQAAI